MDLKWGYDEKAGIDAIRRLVTEVSETKIIAITVYPHLVEEAKNAGALAAVNKEIPKRQLIDEIRSVYKLPLPPPPPAQDVAPVEALTDREREVLTLMAEGKTDKEIAKDLNIVESTAKNHVANILKKLGVPNRAGAVAAAYRLRLIPGERR
jgi:DNA-binding NarL/FixJ family response regulator